eukprot:9915349-Alexandrium_andersonii.AAC.1
MEETEQLVDIDREVEFTPAPVRELAILRGLDGDVTTDSEAVPMCTWGQTIAEGSKVEVAILQDGSVLAIFDCMDTIQPPAVAIPEVSKEA